MKILMISRKAKQCGVSDYGLRLFSILQPNFDITFREVDTLEDCNPDGYDIVLYNYHYSTLPFITDEVLDGAKNHIAIFHEASLNFTPDHVIDTSIRPLFERVSLPKTINQIPTIGSFGFGFPDKNYSRIAELVKEQFQEAIIKLNIPFAEYGDKDGYLAKREAEKVKTILEGTNIQLEVNHEYFSQADLLDFLQRNDLNLFLYNQSTGRGLSSTIDYALSVRRPIGISNSEMFRHLPESIIVDNISLKKLIKTGTDLLKPVYEANTNEKLIEKYKLILQ